MTARELSSTGLSAGALDQLLALRRDVAVPDDLARRIVVRTAVLPQHGTTVAKAVRVTVPVPPRRQSAWVSWGAGLAASVALMLALMPQNLPRTPGQGPARPLPQVAAADVPMAVVAVPAPAKVAGRFAGAGQPQLALADPAPAAAPAVTADVASEPASATPKPTLAPDAWPVPQPVTFALAADVVKPQVYGPVLDPGVSYGSASVRAGGTVGLGFAEGGGR